MIKIKLECWWTDSNSISNRFLNQFVFSKDLTVYEFVNKNPDFTIVFGKTEWDSIETPKERTLYFSQEPLWSPNQPKDSIDEFCSKIFISDKRDYPNKDEYIETFLPMLYAGRGESDSRSKWDWSKQIKDIRYQKDKKISIIVTKNGSQHSNALINPLTSKINYNDRCNLGIELSKNEKIDVYGTFWEKNGKNIKGEIWNKHVGLDEYQFSVACENSIQKNYVSEKFWDVILTDGVPIYMGCNNIKDFIPENSFIDITNKPINEMIDIIEDTIQNSEYYYQKYKKEVLDLKNEFFINPNYNLWEKIKLEIKNG